MPQTTAVVGRQRIVDRGELTAGYELLFRPLPTSQSAFDPAAGQILNGDEMTNQTIFGALGIGIDALTGGAPVYCNADRGVLTGHTPVSLPPKQTVIEILETVTIDAAVLDGCRALRAAGYRLAADDFTWFPGAESLLELVEVVKIDVRATPLEQIPDLARCCRQFDVQLLAEKIETPAEYQACKEMGFDLFQGYHLGRPQTISGPASAPSRLGVVRLASAILDDNVDLAAVEDLLRAEPEISYQILQLATLGRFGELQRHVTGLRQALVLIGLNQLRGWIPALLLRPAGRAIDTNLPAVLARARMAELLAGRLHPHLTDLAFTAGMLSALDLLIGVPRSKLPELLEIPMVMREACFDVAHPIGALVAAIIDFEQEGATSAALDDTTRQFYSSAAAQAFAWATRSTELIDRQAAA